MRPAIYRWETPQQLLVGASGDDPIYAWCARCEARDPVLAGHVGDADNAGEVLLRVTKEKVVDLYYCGPCLALEEAENEVRTYELAQAQE